jgi:hypothetical protein
MTASGPSATWRHVSSRSAQRGHSGLDLLTLSSSHFDPEQTIAARWVAGGGPTSRRPASLSARPPEITLIAHRSFAAPRVLPTRVTRGSEQRCNMPWKSNTLLEARSEFVQLALAPNSNIQSLCRRFNISRQTGYRTLERYRIAGARGLESQSRRPHHTSHRCPSPIEAAVLTVRAHHPTWGARKIALHLRSMGCAGVPAPSTITAILARHNH